MLWMECPELHVCSFVMLAECLQIRKSKVLYAARKGNRDLWHATEAMDFKLVTLSQARQGNAQALHWPQVALPCTPAPLCPRFGFSSARSCCLPPKAPAFRAGWDWRQLKMSTGPWSPDKGGKDQTEQLSVILQSWTSVCLPPQWLRGLNWLKTPLGILFRGVMGLALALLQGLKWTRQYSPTAKTHRHLPASSHPGS